MRVIIGAVLAVALGGAQEAPEAEMPPTLEAYITELGVLAYLFGACEAHMDRETSARVFAQMLPPDEDPAKARLSAIYMKSYSEGRLSPEGRRLTGERCLALIEDATDKVEQARRAHVLRP